MTELPRKRPESVPLAVTCNCSRCRDRRIPLHVCVSWLTLTSGWVLPPDTPMQTFRFACGDVRVITWGDIQSLRRRQTPREAA
jgi:hypothetical protein